MSTDLHYGICRLENGRYTLSLGIGGTTVAVHANPDAHASGSDRTSAARGQGRAAALTIEDGMIHFRDYR